MPRKPNPRRAFLKSHRVVALESDLPRHGLRRGDLGAIVDDAKTGDEFLVEFITLAGDTVAVVTARPDMLRIIPFGEARLVCDRTEPDRVPNVGVPPRGV